MRCYHLVTRSTLGNRDIIGILGTYSNMRAAREMYQFLDQYREDEGMNIIELDIISGIVEEESGINE